MPEAPFRRLGFSDFTSAYRSGSTTPLAVANNCLQAVRVSDGHEPPLRAVIRLLDDTALAEAEASTERYERGEPRSPIDGIPVMFKDNLDIAGVETTNGTRLSFPVPTRTARVVERLRDAGAIVVAKTNLHEIGAGTTGINPHHGTPRNPYDIRCWCGGSSSGSASAVGAGLTPLAIGSDAGGSVRAPAAFVGAVGLKPTFGRVSRIGLSIVCDTLDHLGPITTSCRDAALALCAIGGVCRDDEETWDQPPLPDYDAAGALLTGDVSKRRIGFARRLLEHHQVDPAVAAHVERAARALQDAGATLVDVDVPSLDFCRNVGLLLLGAEGVSGLEEFLFRHERELGHDLQVLLRVGAEISARDYLQAQRVRNEIRAEWAGILAGLDAVLTPGPGLVAQPIRPDAERTGELDEAHSAKAISNTFPQNLTGFPAVTVPCGFAGGMPVSAQIIAAPWRELSALDIGVAIERAQPAAPLRPARFYGDRLLS